MPRPPRGPDQRLLRGDGQVPDGGGHALGPVVVGKQLVFTSPSVTQYMFDQNAGDNGWAHIAVNNGIEPRERGLIPTRGTVGGGSRRPAPPSGPRGEMQKRMIRYIIRRLLWAVLVLIDLVFMTYVIFFLMPTGDPAVRLAGKSPTPEMARRRSVNSFGLDQPWYVQYLLFVKRVFLGDQYGWPGLGFSFSTRSR